MSQQSVEPVRPVAAVGLEPRVHLGERLRTRAVPALPAAGMDVYKPDLAEHLEVLRAAGLAERQTRDQVAERALTDAQQVEDLAALLFGQRCVGRRLDQRVGITLRGPVGLLR